MKKFITIATLVTVTLGISSIEIVSGHGRSRPDPNSARDVGPRESVTLATNFVNYETPHVHPLDISPDGTLLAVVNTPDGHVDIFDITPAGDRALPRPVPCFSATA